ncbi:hypothetical protein TWF718_006409 [Orbilia javanica]|uniref:Uncharacterized protein n=1 Tax=Orbilia javanica TaxID=47235 RepID=A0AAN8N322_9PEZI
MHPIPLLLLLLTAANPALAKFNWGSAWKNSKLDGWDAHFERSGSLTGWYQLSCKVAKERVVHGNFLGGPLNSGKAPLDVIANCERSCRCNMFGQFLLNPLAGEVCNTDIFLRRCIASDRGGLGCVCAWVQQQDEASSGVSGQWRDQPFRSPGEKGDAPGNMKHSGPHSDAETAPGTNPADSGGGWHFKWSDEKDFKRH